MMTMRGAQSRSSRCLRKAASRTVSLLRIAAVFFIVNLLPLDHLYSYSLLLRLESSSSTVG
jgi:hypothetical protein